MAGMEQWWETVNMADMEQWRETVNMADMEQWRKTVNMADMDHVCTSIVGIDLHCLVILYTT